MWKQTLLTLLLCSSPLSAQTIEVTGLRGKYADPLYPDQLLLKLPDKTYEFQGSTGVDPVGERPFPSFTIHPDQKQFFEDLVQGAQLRYFIGPPPSLPLKPKPTSQQRYNYYQSLLLQHHHQLGQLPCVLGLRGKAPDGSLHSARDNFGGYNDTFVILKPNGVLHEFLGCTHAADPKDPDAPAAGVAQVRPGHYRAISIGYHHGQPCWQVYTRDGQGLIPCARDADRDGHISDSEQAKVARASHILFHNGLYAERPSSIGCLTLAPDTYPKFAAHLHPKPFDFHLLDADNLPALPLQITYPLGKTRKGQRIDLIQLGHGPRIALLFATIHGDEPAGSDLLRRLQVYLQDHPEILETWQVRLIVHLNRDSQARTNLAGVDLNRNFPAAWKRSAQGAEYSGPSALSEPESQALSKAVLGQWPAPSGRPERILSFHQHRGIPEGQGWLDADGPAQELVAAMQSRAQSRLSLHKVADSQGRLRIPGSFGTWAHHLNIPTVTFELSSADRNAEANWENYHQSLLEFFSHP